jgi:cell division protein FtsB
MPAASVPHARARRSSRERQLALTLGAGVRWDRLGRVAMLCVLAALLYLYASAGVHMLSSWHQASHDDAALAAMQRENRQLVQQHEVLSRQETLEVQARRLGMIKAGEQPYLVTGLPRN